MKKIIILIGLILILSINTLAAPIDFVLQKTTYNTLETVQLELQLNIKQDFKQYKEIQVYLPQKKQHEKMN